MIGPRRRVVHIDAFEFGRITIDGSIYQHDVVIEGAEIRKRKKGPSKALRGDLGHTPLTAAETIPWKAKRLWIGTGAYGSLPVSDDVRKEARRRGVELLVATTPELVKRINQGLPAGTNVILHVTC
jgi:hypothetical protein